ncbi:MAG: RagB/SusD family nutrient uptake outer membrane protein [Bacteroidales bacterium]|nr:RagB/SusD family nutrient uptake outer membrane protein [Bacteroidales bacterium]
MDAIKQERKVELAFEGLRYWDLRRWGDSSKDYSEGGLANYQQHGLKITKTGDDTYLYQYVTVDEKDRTFAERLYRFPMPESELNSNKLVDQYPEWK